jgi:hypothetical protein
MDSNNTILNPKIILNTKYIDSIKKLFNDNLDIEQKIDFLNYMVYFLTSNVTKYFSDNFIEEQLNKISSDINFDLSKTYKKNTVIHILTESYTTGGHTKLLELFIENTKDYFDEQSVILTEQRVEIPKSLKNITKSTGEIISFEKDTYINKAKKLAKISSHYELVVLHIHPHDIIANLAFGNTQFKRNIIFVNHADHMFWCGVSIADITLHISSSSKKFSIASRGTQNNEVIYIPLKEKEKNLHKDEARKQLKIPNNKKIILSIASEYKYGKTKEEISIFINMAKNIVKNINNCEFILIGPSLKNKYWENAYKTSNGKINPIGIQPRELLDYYIASSDIYIESFPMTSTTALLEVAQQNIKIFTLKSNNFPPDVALKNNMIIDSVSKLEEKTIKFLTNKQEDLDIDLSMHFKDKWKNNLQNILKKYTQNKHTTHNFETIDAKTEFINHTYNIIGSKAPLGDIFTKLPFFLKLHLLKNMSKFAIIDNFKTYIKAYRKVFLKGVFK